MLIICYIFRHISHKKDFFDALKYCKKSRHERYNFDENQQFNQDISNLLTVGKLHYFLENALDEFGSNYIWLNAFKVNDLWYESHKVRHDQIPSKVLLIRINPYILGRIVPFIEGKSPSRHKRRICI